MFLGARDFGVFGAFLGIFGVFGACEFLGFWSRVFLGFTVGGFGFWFILGFGCRGVCGFGDFGGVEVCAFGVLLGRGFFLWWFSCVCVLGGSCGFDLAF